MKFSVLCLTLQLAYAFAAIPELSSGFEFPHLTPKKVESKHVTFRLYTRENPDKYIELFTGKLSDIPELDPSRQFKFITHGFVDFAGNKWLLNAKNEYLKKGNYNIVAMDWRIPASALYPTSARNTRDVGKFLAEFIADLHKTHGVPLSNVHLIGHSLGSHVSAFAGQNLIASLGQKVARITGLDPAGPLFVSNSEDERLDPGDAEFVDAIHTDGGKFGYMKSLAHADFFPNGGYAPQPGCILTFNNRENVNTRDITEAAYCSHSRVLYLFVESINSLEFIGHECDKLKTYKKGECFNNKSAIMGENIDLSTRGNFYLTTFRKSPYAKNGKV